MHFLKLPDLFLHCNSFFNLTELHAAIFKLGLQHDLFILTRFASVSSRFNAVQYACSFIFPHNHHDTFLLNTVIKACAEAETPQLKCNGVHYFRQMLRQSVDPNHYTFPFVLKACAGIGDLKLGSMVHLSALKLGLHDGVHAMNSLIHMYCCCDGGLGFGRKVFDEMPERNPVSWSAIIGGCVRWGMSIEAIELFRGLQTAGMRPTEPTMVMILSACADLGALELGRWVESYIEQRKFEMRPELYNALIDMFAKCGDVDKALRLFRRMPKKKKTVVSWTSLIFGMALHGHGLEAISLFEEMRRTGIVPDDVVFIALLSACSHSGLVDEGQQYFDSMVKVYGIAPRIEHYGCMADLLSRAGLVKEALEFIDRMPVAPNPAIWRTLITACRAQGQLNLGERLSKDLIVNDPMLEANYVMLSGIYAKMSAWEKKTRVREVMGGKGIRKIPGSTMIELEDGIYEFVAGDKSQSEYLKIYEMVDEMEKKIRAAGYMARTSDVMLDIAEEDKEGVLNRHSEKLAIAFALLRTPPGSPIRLVKNLRVCDDCHSATNFISIVYKREIVVRDRNRFHRFWDGVCSCRDFW